MPTIRHERSCRPASFSHLQQFGLKRGSTPDQAIGQLARYMGWVKQTIGRDRDAHGVIVAKSIGDRLRYAVSIIPNVSLFAYEVNFHLRPAHEFG